MGAHQCIEAGVAGRFELEGFFGEPRFGDAEVPDEPVDVLSAHRYLAAFDSAGCLYPESVLLEESPEFALVYAPEGPCGDEPVPEGFGVEHAFACTA